MQIFRYRTDRIVRIHELPVTFFKSSAQDRDDSPWGNLF